MLTGQREAEVFEKARSGSKIKLDGNKNRIGSRPTRMRPCSTIITSFTTAGSILGSLSKKLFWKLCSCLVDLNFQQDVCLRDNRVRGR